MGLKIVLDTREASRNADEFAKAIARVAQATGLAGKSADELMRLTAKMSRRFGRIGSSADKAGSSVATMGQNMGMASAKIGKFGDVSGRAVGNTDKLSKSVKRLALGFIGLRTITASVSTLAKLEQGIVTLGTVTGKTGKELKELQRISVGVAQATKFTPTEAIAALLELSRAGQSASVAAKSLKSVADLAAAGVLDLGSAAGLVAASMAQFNKQGLGAAEAAGILVAVADRTKSTVASLGSALSQAGQAAASFNIDMTQATAALGVLQTAGVQASRTGRSLKTILTSLVVNVKTEKGKNALDVLGLSAEDLTAKEGDLIGMLKRLRGALLNLSDTQQVDVLNTLVGKDFLANLATLSNDVEDIEAIVGKTREALASDELGSKAAIQNETLSGSIKDVSAAYQEMLLVVGDGGATGAMKGFFRSLADAVRILGGVDGAMGKASTSAKAFASVMKGIGAALALRAIISVGASALGTLLGIKRAMMGVATAQGAVSRSSPWGLITIGITAAIFALDKLSEKERERAERQKEAKREADSAQTIGARVAEAVETRAFSVTRRGHERLGPEKSNLLQGSDIETGRQGLESLVSRFKDERDKTKSLSADLINNLRRFMTSEQKVIIDNAREAAKRVATLIKQARDTASKGIGKSLSGANGAGRKRYADALKEIERLESIPKFNVPREFEVQLVKQAEDALALAESNLKKSRDKNRISGEEVKPKSEAAKSLGIDLEIEKATIKLRDFRRQFKEAVADQTKSFVLKVGTPTPEELKKLIGDVNVQLAEIRGADFDQDPDLANLTRKISDLKVDEIASLEKARTLKKIARDLDTESRAQGRKGDAAKIAAEKKVKKELMDQLAIRKKMAKFSLATDLKKVTDGFGDDLREQAEAAISKFNDARNAGFNEEESRRFGLDAADSVSIVQAEEAASDLRSEKFRILIDEFNDRRQTLERIGLQFGNSFSQALLSLANNSKSAKEAFGDMAKTIIAQIIRIQAAKGFASLFSFAAGPKPVEESATTESGISSLIPNLMSWLGSFGGGATGNQMGGLIPAQQGRIISSPTVLRRGGKNFSVSEGGGSTPEGVFPLTKNARGQLSINAVGASGGTYNLSFPGIRNSADAKAAKRTIGQTVGALIASSESKKNRMGMRPKK